MSDELHHIDENGVKQDADLHDAILRDGDVKGEFKRRRAELQAAGVSQPTIDATYPEFDEGNITPDHKIWNLRDAALHYGRRTVGEFLAASPDKEAALRGLAADHRAGDIAFVAPPKISVGK